MEPSTWPAPNHIKKKKNIPTSLPSHRTASADNIPLEIMFNSSRTSFILDPKADDNQLLSVTLVQSTKKGNEDIGMGMLNIKHDVMK